MSGQMLPDTVRFTIVLSLACQVALPEHVIDLSRTDHLCTQRIALNGGQTRCGRHGNGPPMPLEVLFRITL